MSSRSRQLAAALAVAITLVVTGCGQRPDQRSGGTEAIFQERARAVHDAWVGGIAGPAGQAWRTGLVPLEDLTIPPATGFTPDTSFAFSSGWYTSVVALPTDQPPPGRVVFPGGALMTVPVESATAAYRRIDKGDPPCQSAGGPSRTPTFPPSFPPGVTGAPAQHTCAILTVTGVRFATTSLRTSRGVATVPAWLFTVAELPAPVARVAVAPTTLSPLPEPTLAAMAADNARGLAFVNKLTGVADHTLSFTIGVGGCARNPRGISYQTADAVIIAGTVENSAGPCAASLALQPVTTTLADPIDDRVVLDALSGRPLTLDRSRA